MAVAKDGFFKCLESFADSESSGRRYVNGSAKSPGRLIARASFTTQLPGAYAPSAVSGIGIRSTGIHSEILFSFGWSYFGFVLFFATVCSWV